jgi:hypothetical protein
MRRKRGHKTRNIQDEYSTPRGSVWRSVLFPLDHLYLASLGKRGIYGAGRKKIASGF